MFFTLVITPIKPSTKTFGLSSFGLTFGLATTFSPGFGNATGGTGPLFGVAFLVPFFVKPMYL